MAVASTGAGWHLDVLILRRAISMAIDREAIAKAVYANQAQPCFYVQPFMGKWALKMDELDASVQQYYKFNLPEAKKLVEEAGGSRLNLKFAYPFNGFGAQSPTVAQMVYNMLTALPWKIALVPIDFYKDFVGGGKGMQFGNYPADTLLWGGLSSPSETDEYLFSYYHSQGAIHRENLKDPTLDAMIDKARTIIDPESRRVAYLSVQKYLAEKMYTVAGMPGGKSYTLSQPRVHNYEYAPETGNIAESWMRIWLQK